MTRLQSIRKICEKEYITDDDIYVITRYLYSIPDEQISRAFEYIDTAIKRFESKEHYEVCAALLNVKLEIIDFV